MQLRAHLRAAVLVLLGLGSATIEESLIHTDDGCALETHCNACLLQLGTAGVEVAVFALPRAVAIGERLAPPPVSSYEEARPLTASSRGPPSGEKVS